MALWLLALVALVAQVAQAAPFNPSALTKFNVFVKTPASAEPLQTGGRLVERHLSYLAQAGFQSILSVVEFATNDTTFNGVSGSFPSTAYEVQLAESVGLVEKHVASSFTVEYAKQISDLIDSLPKPLYVHCHVGYMANLFVQLHLFLKGEVLASDLYPNGINLGYDYQNNTDVVNLINELTGRTDVTTPERIEQTLAQTEYSYKYFFWTHRLGNSDAWFNAGQYLETHLGAIQTAGYKTVISFRADGEATARLPTDPATGPVPNYEFSDSTGAYSVQLEGALVRERGLQFVHLPLDSESPTTWTADTFHKYLPALQATVSPALVHCASGYRSAAFVLTYQAYQQRLCSDWVVMKAKQVGFDLHSSAPTAHDLEVLAFSYAVLGC